MSKKEGIHTTIDERIYTDILLPFSSQKNFGFNVVLETLLQIAYELCEQNNMEINSNSLLKLKKRVFNGNYKFNNPIIIQTYNNGETTISVPKEHKEIFDGLMESVRGAVASGEVFIKKIDKNESGKNIETDCKPLLRERVLEYLKDHGGEAPRSEVKKHLELSTQSMSNVLRVLVVEGEIRADNRKDGMIKLI